MKVDSTTSKDAVDNAVAEAKNVIDSTVKDEIIVDGISDYFDLSESKEYWD